MVASLAALGSVIAASSCCLPLLPFVFAAGAAGTSAFVAQLRPLCFAKITSAPKEKRFVARIRKQIGEF